MQLNCKIKALQFYTKRVFAAKSFFPGILFIESLKEVQAFFKAHYEACGYCKCIDKTKRE